MRRDCDERPAGLPDAIYDKIADADRCGGADGIVGSSSSCGTPLKAPKRERRRSNETSSRPAQRTHQVRAGH